MKNLIILVIGLIILITLLIFASTKFDSTSGEFSSDTYVWNIDENTETSEIESETAIGEAKDFYDFTVEDTSGNLVKKSDIAGKPMIIHFWASWCGPCKMLSPIVDQIAEEHDEIKVGKINVDDQPDLAQQFRVMSIPTLVVMKNGEVAATSVGLQPKQAILDLVK